MILRLGKAMRRRDLLQELQDQQPRGMLKSVMRPWCDRCGCARSMTRLNGLGSGSLPLPRIRLTRNTKSAPPGGSRFLLQSALSEQLGLIFGIREHSDRPD